MEKNQFHKYEIMYIIDDKSVENTELIKKELQQILLEDGGEILKEEDSNRQFAQEINHKTSGHYFLLTVKTSTKNIANFNRIFSIKQKQGEVLRKLVINLDLEPINKFKDKPERPTFVANNRYENNDNRYKKNDVREQKEKTSETSEVKSVKNKQNDAEKETRKITIKSEY